MTDRQTDSQYDRQTGSFTDRQSVSQKTDSFTEDRQFHRRQTVSQIDRMIEKCLDKQMENTDKQTDKKK